MSKPFAKNRYALAPLCPCGKSNRDGKFSPLQDASGGYCFSCGKFFRNALGEAPGGKAPGEYPLQCPCGKDNTRSRHCIYVNGTLHRYCFRCDWHVPPETSSPPCSEPCRIDWRFVERTLDRPHHFLTFLTALLGEKTARELAQRYYLGASKHWPGATVFWLIDARREVRSGKVMLYDPLTGKRDKTKNQWAHQLLAEYRGHFRLEQCFFGEHLLPQEPQKPVAIVEAPKTAMVCAAIAPDRIWLATGGKNNLCPPGPWAVLAGREVILYPDGDAYGEWRKWGRKVLAAGVRAVFVEDTLEKALTPEQKRAGWDWVDYLQEKGVGGKCLSGL